MIQRLSSANHKKVIEYLYREKEVNIFLISDIERYGYDSYFFSIYGGINEKGEIEGILLKCFEFIIFYAYDEFDVNEFAKFINESDCEEVCGKSEVLEKLDIIIARLDKQIECSAGEQKENLQLLQEKMMAKHYRMRAHFVAAYRQK